MTFSPEFKARLKDAAGFIFDMDGTIALGDAKSGGHRALPHAIEVLETLKAAGTPFVVFTNGTAKPPAAYANSLRNAGFPVEDSQMLTPSSSAAVWLGKVGMGKVRVLGNPGCAAPLIDVGLEVVGPSQEADGVEAVYTGWFREFDFNALEAACHSLWNGAKLVTASNVPFFATENGRAIGASFPINAMLTAMTGKRPRILGKPSRVAFETAMSIMGLPRSAAKNVVVVGDDPALEMRMANAVGAHSVGLATGIMGGDAALPEKDRPSALLKDLRPLLEAL
ncbi:Haloacid dehalogenase-like hydrolase [Novosphingobium aromaticivorans DSM 12444]|uniref:Haloacid dehalogenase-like hydrolase n=1 Tax=Novosphingobium aromaticivorans (strain ATCC 700278 / DSM 12444 / CCUG 56034 / CIP 105152 / NBRC 16084 / F199) TaxID=279238 RepID=Q2G775_NOVAD|nr:HAD hydrolase-like protein [Novosphingobium aromaticivorans]ABD26298.1 Haloacid dehalogenase-like hydrolase [Novosphingobium aromaticivorans DSM 12444]SCY55210.1 Haloacid Dehalogenase Superfamily Class (subfamily) IIA [Novosphingobium aromaticivorans]